MEHKETVIHADEKGEIHISEDVVAVIAAAAAAETEGVSMLSVSGGGVPDFFSGKKNLQKGIRVALAEDKTVRVDVFVTIAYGKAIPQVAATLQTRIREAVESMTSMTVTDINVTVGGITFEKNK